MAPSTPSSDWVNSDDHELLALPPPKQRFRRITLLSMALATLFSIAQIFLLRHDVGFALSQTKPNDVGELRQLKPRAELSQTWVRGEGNLRLDQAVEYGRLFDSARIVIAPIADNPQIWVELRVPSDAQTEFVAPASFVGRITPWSEAGLRYFMLDSAVRRAAHGALPDHAWLLVDGESPSALRWVVAVAVLFGLFALFNLAGMILLSRPIKPSILRQS